MRLDSDLLTPDPLSVSLVEALARLAIHTSADLLLSDASNTLRSSQTPLQSRALNIYKRLPAGTISLRDLELCLLSVLKKIATPGIAASDLQSRPRTYLSSFPALNRLIDHDNSRGFPSQNVYEISGDHEAGKSTLILNIVLRYLLSQPSDILWIDTTGDFAVDRSLEILQNLMEEPQYSYPPTIDLDSDMDPFAPSPPSLESIKEDALTRLHVSVAFDIQTTYEILDSLGLSTNSSATFVPIQCLVIDALTPLLSPHLSAVSAQGHSLVTTFMHQLKILAVKFDLVVFVINNATLLPPTQNQVNSDPNTVALTSSFSHSRSIFPFVNKKPALGPSFPYMTDATLWIAEWQDVSEAGGDIPGDGTTLHMIEIFRSRMSASNTWCRFKIRGSIVE
ncbi:hypothetical protein K435DRAFT_959425 [Dendrothele bispora CBS 962.96]|uniref:P-loop containing nucleoside triphosphate hydrolase protein n=1 Tax=Dendrothele bispora (strain CBS 962.96) TaxID=1314807 RepID=A0A4S8MXL6_DENBC|nr:hypothetical protein K435DRAFT_959425 [Dendrothele bispora CBS 962.96]